MSKVYDIFDGQYHDLPMTILNARCAEIRSEDYAQRWETDATDHNKTVWMCGPDRVKGAYVGMTGRLTYKSNGQRGWFAYAEK